MEKQKDLIIVGDSAFAEVAYECFTVDSPYRVVGFAVESKFKTKDTLFNLPIVDLESVEKHFSPAKTDFYAALVYTQLNRLRKRLYLATKAKGYKPASYVSSRAFVWGNVQIGEHAFIFEDNTIQPFVKIGDNVVLWSGNHVGHHSVIQSHCFVASHAVISGFCNIGESCFVGVNATLSNNVTIGADNWIGLGATIVKNTAPNTLFKGERAESAPVTALDYFKVTEP